MPKPGAVKKKGPRDPGEVKIIEGRKSIFSESGERGAHTRKRRRKGYSLRCLGRNANGRDLET